MHTNTFFLGLSFSALASAAATSSYPSPTAVPPLTQPLPGQAYSVGYPLCGIPGWTNGPGLFHETIHLQSGSTLECCLKECRDAYPACKSIAFHARYTECLFFDDVVENTQLIEDKTSEFVHYDLECKD